MPPLPEGDPIDDRPPEDDPTEEEDSALEEHPTLEQNPVHEEHPAEVLQDEVKWRPLTATTTITCIQKTVESIVR